MRFKNNGGEILGAFLYSNLFYFSRLEGFIILFDFCFIAFQLYLFYIFVHLFKYFNIFPGFSM